MIFLILVVSMRSTKIGSAKSESSSTLSALCERGSSRSCRGWTEKLTWRTSNSPQRQKSCLADSLMFTWMNKQLFNVLTQKTVRTPLPDGEEYVTRRRVCCAGAWVKLLRAYKGKNASRSQRHTERVHDIKRVSSLSEVLARMDMWEAALKEHVMDTGCEAADITMANCLRRLVHPRLSADFQKMSHIVRYIDVKKGHHRPSWFAIVSRPRAPKE